MVFQIIIRIFLTVKIIFELKQRISKKIYQIGLGVLELCAFKFLYYRYNIFANINCEIKVYFDFRLNRSFSNLDK